MGKSRRVVLVDGTPFFRKMDGVARYSVSLVSQLAHDNPDTTFLILCFIDDVIASSLLPNSANIAYKKILLPRKIYSGLYSRVFKIPVDWLVGYRNRVFLSPNFSIFPYIKHATHVVVIHDAAYLDKPESLEVKNRKHLTKNISWSLKRTQAIIGVSRFTLGRMAEHYKTNLIQKLVVYPRTLYSPTTPQPSTTNREDFLLTVGTLEPRKNLAFLIEAHRAMPEATQKKHPLIVAGGKGWGDTQHLDFSSPYINFVEKPSDEDLTKLYQKAHLFIFPSLYEGFGIPVLEALQHGTPVLSHDIPPVREFADGFATLYSDSNPQEFALTLENQLKKQLNPVAYSSRDIQDDYEKLIEIIRG